MSQSLENIERSFRKQRENARVKWQRVMAQCENNPAGTIEFRDNTPPIDKSEAPTP